MACRIKAEELDSIPQIDRRLPAREIGAATSLLPQRYQKEATQALKRAGKNASELAQAIRLLSPKQREGLAFLLVNMPRRDLTSLSGAFLVDNVRLAYQVREEVSWGTMIPEEIFLNDVLPYSSVNERRDNWRSEFYKRFLKMAQESGSMEKAVKRLNEEVFAQLHVQFHSVKRPKPDQSPYETIRAGYASCTGLSILLVAALRSVGIPSRLAGIPLWPDQSGNHTWVEVWDNGWHYIGAAEPGVYDETWFTKKVQAMDPANRGFRIYAVSFQKTSLKFPCIWNPKISYVSAVDVTPAYQKTPALESPSN